jgi:small subunit ribosomal protein S17
MRKLKGTIVSRKMAKTVVVRVDRLRKHPKYQKYHRLSSTFKAHTENNEGNEGDVVIIEEIRPMSKDKRWKVVELVKRSIVDEVDEVGEVDKVGENDS